MIIAALVAIGLAQRNDPDRAARTQFRDALYSAPRRRPFVAETTGTDSDAQQDESTVEEPGPVSPEADEPRQDQPEK